MYSDCTPDYLKMTALNIPAALVVCCLPPPPPPGSACLMNHELLLPCQPTPSYVVHRALPCILEVTQHHGWTMCAILYGNALPLGVPLCLEQALIVFSTQAVYIFWHKGLRLCTVTSGHQESASQTLSAVLPCSLCVHVASVHFVLLVHTVCRT